MKKIALFFILCLFAFAAETQIRIYKSDPQKYVTLDKQATRQTLINCFGTPNSYKTYYDDEYHNGQVADYNYGQLILTTVNDIFDNFLIKGNSYTVKILDKYTVRVGDSIENLIRTIPSQDGQFRVRGKDVILFVRLEGYDVLADLPLVFGFDTEGKITTIAYTN